MATRSKWEAKIVVPSTDWSDTGNFQLAESAGGVATDITITSGNYWWSSGDGAGNDFAAHLKAMLDATSVTIGNSLAYTVTVDATATGTGKLTIAVSSGNYTITWGSADGQTVRDLCGFTGNITAQTTSTGNSQVQALWLPDSPAETPYHVSSLGKAIASGVVSISEDGTYYAFQGARYRMNEYVYRFITQEKAITVAESPANAAYETFWNDAIGGDGAWARIGQQLRFHEDADKDGTYVEYNMRDVREPSYQRSPQTSHWDGLWDVTIPVTEYVSG